MNVTEDHNVVKKCFRCEHLLYESLNIAYNETTSMVVLWNKFQIFVYDDKKLCSTAKVFVPEFQIQQLILSKNYILCLDNSSNVHTISLKFKNPAQKRFKTNFQPREQNIFVSHLVQDYAISLKYAAENYFLCFHKINTEFLLETEIMLKYTNYWPLSKPVLGKCLLHSHKISQGDIELIKELYSVNQAMPKDCNIILISLDKLTVFSSLISTRPSEDKITLVKLYTCPAKICDIKVNNDLTLLIGLTTGSIMSFSLKDTKKPHRIVHLNNAIHKCLVLKETLIYSDGLTMWRTDKTFQDEIRFRQFKVKHVKDFVKCGDELICTTYTNLIYVISIDDESSYLKTSNDEYCPAEKFLNNSDVLFKILQEIDKNDDIMKKIKEETNYITALSLSNRQDIMDTVIQENIIVYENYDEVRKDHTNLILTDKMTEYFESNIFLILIQLTTTALHHVFNDMLSKLFDNLIVHVTLMSNGKLLKTASKKLWEALKKFNILTVVNNKYGDISEIDVYTKIVVSMPGSHDQKQTLWTCLYRKHVKLCSEHFIKTNHLTMDIDIKKSEDTIENLIYKTAQCHHKHLFKIVDASKHKGNLLNWSMYLKLPVNYRDLLMCSNNTKEFFNARRTDYLLQQYTSKEFLESKSDIQFEIGSVKVKIRIINDFSEQTLNITSDNICIAYNIRNYFSKLIYNDFKDYDSSKYYVQYTLYNIIENLQKELKRCIKEPYTLETFRSLLDQFERNIIGALPI